MTISFFYYLLTPCFALQLNQNYFDNISRFSFVSKYFSSKQKKGRQKEEGSLYLLITFLSNPLTAASPKITLCQKVTVLLLLSNSLTAATPKGLLRRHFLPLVEILFLSFCFDKKGEKGSKKISTHTNLLIAFFLL